MYISPVNKQKQPEKKAWANYVVYDYDTGVFYALFGTGVKGDANNPSGYAIALDIAKSRDGVHWEFIDENVLPIPGAHAGFGIFKIGEWFYYYPTCSNERIGVHFKVYRTKDFITWEHMGDQYDVAPDRRYYHERWDEVHVIEETEAGNPVYYGYISSETREDAGGPGCGFMKSRDGISWEVLPPIEIVWGDIPSHHMELNFVEKISGRYYLSMSGRMYMDSYGYSLYTFVGDSPMGPFYPDREKFRLSGNSRRDITWLGHSIKTPQGFLSALWLSHDTSPDIPSYSFAIADLKRIVCDNGHLRYAYWAGSETVKGAEIPVNFALARIIHPLENVKSPRDTVTVSNQEVTVSASRDGVIWELPAEIDFQKGVVIEGNLLVKENRTQIATHQHAAGAGFYFEGSAQGEGTAIIADTLGVTRCGSLRYGAKKITDRNPYRYAGKGLADGRSGPLQGTLDFAYDDTVGPYGHASYCGIRHNVTHAFRIHARGDYFELYIDDWYVQTYLLPENASGQIGFCCLDGIACLSNVKMWSMNLS